MTVRLLDAQAALSFVQNAATYIEPEVDKIEYPDIQYPELIPVDFSAPEWVKTVTFYSVDQSGRADWFHHLAKDMPKADVERARHETAIHMAGIGYGYSLEEISQAQAMGVPLTSDRAEAARRGYEEFMDDIALNGDSGKGFEGLIDHSAVTAANVAADGAGGGGSQTEWIYKTPDQIARDINDALITTWTDTKQIGIADTLLLSPERYAYLVSTRLSDTSDTTLWDWIMRTNIYTATTGQRLTIRAVRGLSTAGASSSQRMVVYRRDPRVLKMHVPMRHRWLPVWQTGPILFDVPGIFRTGGLEVKRPKLIRYYDMI